MSLSRAALIQTSRVHAMREAAVASIGALFSDVETRAHPGRLDMNDALTKGVFTAPSIHVAAARITRDERLSGGDDLMVEMTAYVVAEDLMVADRRVERDEMALAICQALLTALADDDLTRWGQDDIGPAQEARATPLFTLKSLTQGAVYWAVTWKQTLYAAAPPHFGALYEEEPVL